MMQAQCVAELMDSRRSAVVDVPRVLVLGDRDVKVE